MGKRYTIVSRTGEPVDVTAAVLTYARPPREASPWVRGYRMGMLEVVDAFAGHLGVEDFQGHVEAVMFMMDQRYDGD